MIHCNLQYKGRLPSTSWLFLFLMLSSDVVHSFTTSFRTPVRSTSPLTSPLTKLYMSQSKRYKHTLAILSMPSTSTDRIANEAILDAAVRHTRKLSVVLRCQTGKNPSLARLRRYVGEVYSTLWDVAMATGDPDFCDVVVYPQNFPNAAPESWIHNAPDLDSVCSHDSICGWVSESAMGRGLQFQMRQGDGMGGLDAHVQAMNADRLWRKLSPVSAVHVDPWPKGASAKWQIQNNVAFLDDEEEGEEEEQEKDTNLLLYPTNGDTLRGAASNGDRNGDDLFDSDSCNLIGGPRIPTECLFDKVAVGGTFDGMHYGHRKLLTLAVSSVNPSSGKLLIGVTVDEMLRHKSYNEEIPTLQERMEGVRDFVYRLAPGIKNRVKLRPIDDEYGPPGTVEEGGDFDALVLSHETLENGHKLNEYRRDVLGMPPLALLCTRRTEPHGMSSSALRRRRWELKQKQNPNSRVA